MRNNFENTVSQEQMEYKIVYRDGSIYKIIDRIFSEDSAQMILLMVNKAGYGDARIESIPVAQKEEEIKKVFLPEGFFLTVEGHLSTDYPGINIFLNHKDHKPELIGIVEYNSDRRGIFVGNYAANSDDLRFYVKYCDCPKPKSNMKKYWCVTTSVNNQGITTCLITGVKEDCHKPKNSFTSTRQRDIYNDWFESEKEANAFVEKSKKA